MNVKEKIRAEVERLKNDLTQAENKSEIDMGRISAFEDILLYIDSILEESVSEELIEELKKIVNIRECVSQGIPVIKIAYHFAQWQKEQIMKDALDAVINSKENDLILYQSLPAFITKNDWHRGDKLKLIIIKED